MKYAIAIHGGSGHIDRGLNEEQLKEYLDSLEEALQSGLQILQSGGSSLDAVEASVRYLEDHPLYNAGKGSVFTSTGGHEMDASIMSGRDLACGSVGGVTTIKNPISLARKVMENSPHVMFVAEGAENFASEQGVERANKDYFFTQHRYDQFLLAQNRNVTVVSESSDKKSLEQENVPGGQEYKGYSKGTVGAVALDCNGDLAAATSTGGMTNKRPGRIGDSPIIGAGTYAKNGFAAVSGTGWGEQFIRHAVSHSVVSIMEYGGKSLEEATNEVVFKKLNKEDGGLIAVDHLGNVSMPYNSEGMFRGMANSEGIKQVKIFE